MNKIKYAKFSKTIQVSEFNAKHLANNFIS